MKPWVKRFDVLIRKTATCWLWTGPRMSTGYGMFEGHLAHRVAYTIENGLIPRGKFICHHCNTPLCVRPDHLFIGTNMDNMRDAIKKGRMSPAFMRWSKDFGRRLVKRAG